MPEYTAVFPAVSAAKAFAERLAQPGNWAINIVQKGRTVTFDKDIPEEYRDEATPYYFRDTLDVVGYFGSSLRRKATLNGVPAPFIW